MAKNIGTAAFLSDNTSLLPENCCNPIFFVILRFIPFVCIGAMQRNQKKAKSGPAHPELQTWAGQN